MIKLSNLLLSCTLTLSTHTIAHNLPSLPEPVSNNAVTIVTTKQGEYLLSFMGLADKKDHTAIHNKVWALNISKPDKKWQIQKPVPSSLTLKGRLASVATSIGSDAYLFGGYTVSKDHQEISSPDVFKFDVINNEYTQLANMPVPVDDSIALSYLNRYIYLVSGWHNDGNVNLVQVYDTKTNTWQQASPFIGKPVFGQAGAISNNIMLVCDGVSIKAHKNKRRSYQGIAQCYKGTIDINNPLKIDWRIVDHPTNTPRYRMAATSVNNTIVMLGGSTNPYNYNGIGYDGTPSPASSEIWLFDLKTQQWQIENNHYQKTMDHRGLIFHSDRLITLGGMDNNQNVISDVVIRKLK
jgi:N-acetylneuraminic acid mutarotase